jgi:hypothetical protein
MNDANEDRVMIMKLPTLKSPQRSINQSRPFLVEKIKRRRISNVNAAALSERSDDESQRWVLWLHERISNRRSRLSLPV